MITQEYTKQSGNPDIDKVVKGLITEGFNMRACLAEPATFIALLESQTELVKIWVCSEMAELKYKNYTEVDGWIQRGDIHSSPEKRKNQRVSAYLNRGLK